MGKIEIISNKLAKIYIDGKDFGVIKKETKEYELEKEEHEIYAKSAWCRSQKVKIFLEENEKTIFTLDGFKYEDLTRVIIILFVMFFKFTQSIIFLIISGILLLYPLYYITIGSNKYLQLELKNSGT